MILARQQENKYVERVVEAVYEMGLDATITTESNHQSFTLLRIFGNMLTKRCLYIDQLYAGDGTLAFS